MLELHSPSIVLNANFLDESKNDKNEIKSVKITCHEQGIATSQFFITIGKTKFMVDRKLFISGLLFLDEKAGQVVNEYMKYRNLACELNCDDKEK
jgi:cyclophilin family peptidyl-prolyl cis-trans isomerase